MCAHNLKGRKTIFPSRKTVAEAVQRPTMKLVATKTAPLNSRVSGRERSGASRGRAGRIFLV
jgi:hypothetical protein